MYTTILEFTWCPLPFFGSVQKTALKTIFWKSSPSTARSSNKSLLFRSIWLEKFWDHSQNIYSCIKWLHCTFENFMVTTGKKEPLHGYPRTSLKSHINFSNTPSVFQQKRSLHLGDCFAWQRYKEPQQIKSNGFKRQNINSECAS